MRRTPGSPIPDDFVSPEYSIVEYKKGDEHDWVSIMLEHDEFKTADDGLTYFRNEFKEYYDELSRRCLFLVNSDGEKVGTTTNWWMYTGVRRDPWIKWVFLRPEYLGKGLGQSFFYEGLRRMIDIEGDREIYLQSQTWSEKAVNIYRKAGFDIAYETGIGGYAGTDPMKANETLKPYYR